MEFTEEGILLDITENLFDLVCVCILPRVMTINIAINNNIKVYNNKQDE
ncbi:hypothetical protein bcere0030_25760 [Bacillus cereus AH1273]|nr:hypothetical protein bcere0030_25760 [Bacillus cereus AH1273]